MNSSSQKKPVARKQGVVVERLVDEVLVYDVERDRAHCLNETAAFVWQQCDGRTTTKEMTRRLGKHVGATIDEKVVWLALDQLGRNHLLEQRPVTPAAFAGMNRREMVRALGLAAVVAIPVVTSIVAPTPAQAVTCFSNGTGCSSGIQCCSGCCNLSVCAPIQDCG